MREANDVHIVGTSSSVAGHKTLVQGLLVVCGSVISPRDYQDLRQAGVAAIYGPETNIPKAAAEILAILRCYRQAAA
jgi:methylmalonyl-CoA mutase